MLVIAPQHLDRGILLPASHIQARAHLIDSLKPSSSSLSLTLSREYRSNQPCILIPMFSEMFLCRHVSLQCLKSQCSLSQKAQDCRDVFIDPKYLRCCWKDDLCVTHALCNVEFCHICPSCRCRPGRSFQIAGSVYWRDAE